VGKRVAVGLAITTPYGYHSKWPDTWEGRSVVQESQLSTYFAQPTVGFRLNDNFSAGVGFVYAFGKYTQRRALGQYDDPAAQASFSATGSGMGVSAGLYGRSGDNLAFGISYRTGMKLKFKDGTATYANVPGRDAALYPASSSFSTQVNLPSTLSVGLADRITNKLLLTFDFTLSGWSSLDSLNFDVAASGGVPASHITSVRKYEDALAFRIGTEYQATPKLTLLGGISYDETPVRDEAINPEFVDANRFGVSAGLSYQLSSRLALEGAYSFTYGQLRTARANTSLENLSNISGTYRTATNTAALGVSVAF
jgi:long-chain fatty acid transport protein